jgi:hypothetical protein
MPEPPTDTTPTYQTSDQGGVTHYTCLVQDASRPGGVCSHDATDFELFTLHMQQRHGGFMIEAPSALGTAGVMGTPALSPTVPVTTETGDETTPDDAEPAPQDAEVDPEDEPAASPPPPGDEEKE